MVLRVGKCLLVCLILLSVAGCGGDNSTSPPQPQYTTYTLSVDVGASGMGQAGVVGYVWDVTVGADNSALTTLITPDNSSKKGISVNIRMLSSLTEGTVPVRWTLRNCTGGQNWASAAWFLYWLEVRPVSSGIAVEPTGQQKVGPNTGWIIGTTREMTFKIKKS